MEQTTLQRARDGDEQAFRELTDPYRRELQVHCYRMLGSLTDAEDMLQETLLAAWRGLADFQERASVRTWLYRIATNRCRNALRSAARRIPTEPVPPFQPPEPSRRGEITWLQPYPDTLLAGIADTAPGPEARYQATEAVELAFVAGLQRMPPRQAAALVLRDVLGFATDEVAGMLGTSHTAIKGALQRARAALGHARAGRAPRPGSATEHDLARRFADAFVAADLPHVVALLTDDAWLSMPPAPHEYHGIDAIAAFLRATFAYRGDRRMHLLPTNANTQPAFGSYLVDPAERVATPAGLFVLTVAGDRIQAITRFHIDALYPPLRTARVTATTRGAVHRVRRRAGNSATDPGQALRQVTARL
ncbi:MAG TPA: RNA polymerase subunit sigma-70 [Actinomycetes bacterium]|nr:RNA polymerase subunit sigma-70 [Actinomycetes bacterium]